MMMLRRAALRSEEGTGTGEPEKEGARRADDATEAGGNNTGGRCVPCALQKGVVESEKPRRAEEGEEAARVVGMAHFPGRQILEVSLPVTGVRGE